MLTYEVGDRVMHSKYGGGKIVAITDKGSVETPFLYYIIETGEETLWVPVEEAGKSSLHLLTSTADFPLLVDLLRSHAEKLSNDAKYRRLQLNERMQNGRPRDICLILRDLASYSRTRKLNRQDANTMNQARRYMVDEWQQSLGISREKADIDLKWILYELRYYRRG